MSIEHFHQTADALIDLVEAFINANIQSNGDKASLCQHNSATSELMGLSSVFNGTTEDDLVKPDGDHDRVFLEIDRATAEAVIEAVNMATVSSRLSDDTAERAQQATTRITDALVG